MEEPSGSDDSSRNGNASDGISENRVRNGIVSDGISEKRVRNGTVSGHIWSETLLFRTHAVRNGSVSDGGPKSETETESFRTPVWRKMSEIRPKTGIRKAFCQCKETTL